MADFSRLKADLVDLMDERSSAFTNACGGFINDAIIHIQREWLWGAMMTESEFDTVASQEAYQLATIGPRFHSHEVMQYTDAATDTDITLLMEASPEKFKRRKLLTSDTETEGAPLTFIVNGSEVLFFPIPDAVYSMTWTYYRFLPELTNGSDTNWFTNNIPDVIKYRAAMLASVYLAQDQRKWEGLYRESLMAAKSAEAQGRVRKTRMQVNQLPDYGID